METSLPRLRKFSTCTLNPKVHFAKPKIIFSCSTFLWQMVVFILIDDTCFYWSVLCRIPIFCASQQTKAIYIFPFHFLAPIRMHRLLHTQPLYRYIHSQHHDFKHTVGYRICVRIVIVGIAGTETRGHAGSRRVRVSSGLAISCLSVVTAFAMLLACCTRSVGRWSGLTLSKSCSATSFPPHSGETKGGGESKAPHICGHCTCVGRPLSLGAHPCTAAVYFALKLWQSIDAHSGSVRAHKCTYHTYTYARTLAPTRTHAHTHTHTHTALPAFSYNLPFPLSPFSVIEWMDCAPAHDYHHSHYLGNYGGFFVFWCVCVCLCERLVRGGCSCRWCGA